MERNAIKWAQLGAVALPVALYLGCAGPAASPQASSGTAVGPANAAPPPDEAGANTAAPESAKAPDSTAGTDADAGARGPLEREGAELDKAMRRARERIEAGGTQASRAAQDEFAALEKRYAVVKQQLSDLQTRADQRAAALRKETKAAAESLKKDLDHLVDGLKK